MSTPQTRICICQSLGLSNDYNHTFWFDNVTQQTNFFESKVIKTFVNYTYVRKNWSLKVNASVEDAEKWGYLFFRNTSTGRYYYYFINNVKYISDETVELDLEMDVMQTYLFDYALQPCFVEREHAKIDSIGQNTVEEDVELGQLINAGTSLPESFWNNTVLIMSTVALDKADFPNCYGMTIDGVFSGCNIYRVNTTLGLINLLKALNEAGKIDAIVSMWVYPKALVKASNPDSDISQATTSREEADTYVANRPTSHEGYVPKNNKLFTYPFCYLYSFNSSGNSAIYRFERFDGAYEFRIYGSLFPDGGVKIVPMNYNGVGLNYDESMVLTGYPTCAWTSDTYKVWLAQNQGQQAVQGLASVGAIGSGVAMMATGNIMGGAGAMFAGASGIASQLAQRHDMETHPPQSRGSTSSTLNVNSGSMGIYFYAKTLTAERAEIIDEYFTMYGYRTLRVKTPNRNVRESFTYTKTVGCLITGSLCQEDARKIQSIYDHGVTFWQSSVAIGNYSASNATK